MIAQDPTIINSDNNIFGADNNGPMSNNSGFVTSTQFAAETEAGAISTYNVRNISAEKISAGTINSQVVYAGTINGKQITAGTITINGTSTNLNVASGTLSLNPGSGISLLSSGTAMTAARLNFVQENNNNNYVYHYLDPRGTPAEYSINESNGFSVQYRLGGVRPFDSIDMHANNGLSLQEGTTTMTEIFLQGGVITFMIGGTSLMQLTASGNLKLHGTVIPGGI